MRSDHQDGQCFRPEFVLSQSNIKGDHKCGRTALPDNGHTFVAIWQGTVVNMNSFTKPVCRHGDYFYSKKNISCHTASHTYNANTLFIRCASGKSPNARLAKILLIFYTFNVVLSNFSGSCNEEIFWILSMAKRKCKHNFQMGENYR